MPQTWKKNRVPQKTSSQMSGLHVNDLLPNYRYRGILHLVRCNNCNNQLDHLCNCPRCGWSEIEALDFNLAELREFYKILRANPKTKTDEAFLEVRSKRWEAEKCS
jgi:hypothetical protein